MTKTEHMPMVLKPIPAAKGEKEKRKLYVRGITDKVVYGLYYFRTFKRQLWQPEDEYHNRKMFNAFLDCKCSAMPDNLYAVFEDKLKINYYLIFNPAFIRTGNKLRVNLLVSFDHRKMLINPIMHINNIKKYLTGAETEDRDGDFFSVIFTYPISGELGDKMVDASWRLKKAITRSEKKIMSRIKKI